MKARLFAVLFFTAGVALVIAWAVAAREPAGESRTILNASPVLRLNLGSTDPTIDPALAAEWPSVFVVNQLFLGLMRADEETGAPVPELATAWVMSPDATVFTFTLRSGLTWTDGNPLTAHDVRYGILRSLDPATAVEYPYPLFWIRNAEEYNTGVITDTNLVGVTVLDYAHLRFTLKQPAAFFPSTMTLPVARPMPAWAISAHPTDWTEPAHIVTNGAYRLTAWMHGVSITLEKNPGYYDAANVQIGQVSFVMVDDATAWGMYQAGDLDSVLVPPQEWTAARADPALASQLHAASRLGTSYYGFNTDKAPFDHPLVRMAFAAAVNRQEILDTVTRSADQPALTFTPPGVWGHIDGPAAGVGIPYNPAQARQWLAAGGYPNGHGLPPITLMIDARTGFYDQNLAIASSLRPGWMAELGATVTISQTEWANYLGLLRTDAPQVWQLRWMADYSDGYNFLRDSVDSFGRANYGYWNDLAYEGLLDLAARTADLYERASLYRQVDGILVETDTVMIPIFYWANGIATKPYLERTYGNGGYDGRIADWRITWRVFLPLILRGS